VAPLVIAAPADARAWLVGLVAERTGLPVAAVAGVLLEDTGP